MFFYKNKIYMELNEKWGGFIVDYQKLKWYLTNTEFDRWSISEDRNCSVN